MSGKKAHQNTDVSYVRLSILFVRKGSVFLLVFIGVASLINGPNPLVITDNCFLLIPLSLSLLVYVRLWFLVASAFLSFISVSVFVTSFCLGLVQSSTLHLYICFCLYLSLHL